MLEQEDYNSEVEVIRKQIEILNKELSKYLMRDIKKKDMIKFKKDECVSFIMNNKAYIGCLSKDLLSTDKIVEFLLYTDVDSDKAVFCSLHDMPFLHVKLDDITNIRYSHDSEIALLALNCAENELFFDKKTHMLFPYKIGRAKKGGSYYGIFINNALGDSSYFTSKNFTREGLIGHTHLKTGSTLGIG